MKNRLYKYYPEDFGELTVDVLHMDLVFDVYDDRTNVKSVLRVRTRDAPIEKLELNCRDLEIRAVSCIQSEVSYRYRKDDAILEINFREVIPPHTEVAVITDTVCRPTKNILEGLYYDETPAGAPPQQITQCQQWGFQRIVPCIDDMTAKCTYKTAIIADSQVHEPDYKRGCRGREAYRKARDGTKSSMTTRSRRWRRISFSLAWGLMLLSPGNLNILTEALSCWNCSCRLAQMQLLPKKRLISCMIRSCGFTSSQGLSSSMKRSCLSGRKLWELVRKREKMKLEAKPESTLEELEKVREGLPGLTEPSVPDTGIQGPCTGK